MKHMRSSDFKIGQKCITNDGDIVTVARITARMIEISEELENNKKLFIPAHGEINPLNLKD